MNPKILVPLILIAVFLISAFSYRNELILYWNTDPEFQARFAKIELGQTRPEVETILGKPVHNYEYKEISDYILGWPRYEHTTYAVRFLNDRVIGIYDNYGSF